MLQVQKQKPDSAAATSYNPVHGLALVRTFCLSRDFVHCCRLRVSPDKHTVSTLYRVDIADPSSLWHRVFLFSIALFPFFKKTTTKLWLNIEQQKSECVWEKRHSMLYWNRYIYIFIYALLLFTCICFFHIRANKPTDYWPPDAWITTVRVIYSPQCLIFAVSDTPLKLT